MVVHREERSSASPRGGMPVAIPPDSEVAEEPAPGSAERLSYLDAGGRLVSRETAQFAVVRDFDDRGNVNSLKTGGPAHWRSDRREPGGGPMAAPRWRLECGPTPGRPPRRT